MKQQKEIVILSTFKQGHTDKENAQRHRLLKDMLSDVHLKYMEIEGYYKGDHELSLLVPYKNEEEYNTILHYAFVNFRQESVLVSDYKRDTKLIFNDGLEQRIGKLQRVPETEAIQSQNYSFVPSTRTYWMTKGE